MSLTGNGETMWLCFIFTESPCFLVFLHAKREIPGAHTIRETC